MNVQFHRRTPFELVPSLASERENADPVNLVGKRTYATGLSASSHAYAFRIAEPYRTQRNGEV
jgi:hypothetical protein